MEVADSRDPNSEGGPNPRIEPQAPLGESARLLLEASHLQRRIHGISDTTLVQFPEGSVQPRKAVKRSQRFEQELIRHEQQPEIVPGLVEQIVLDAQAQE